ncbi:MAG: hypothetical protein ABSH09_29850 [Bryobacteraceae bacterium]
MPTAMACLASHYWAAVWSGGLREAWERVKFAQDSDDQLSLAMRKCMFFCRKVRKKSKTPI